MKIKKCDKCKTTYETNERFGMIEHGMGPEVNPGEVRGYINTPILDGIMISSTCGTGKKIDLCDNCISKLFDFLNNKEKNNTINEEGYKHGKRNRIRCICSKRRSKN